MKRFYIISLVLISNFVLSQEMNIGEQENYSTCQSSFFDAGGAEGNAGNELLYTIVSPSEEIFIKVVFEEFDLGNSAILNIYDGDDINTAHLIGTYSGVNLPPSLIAPNLIFEYIPPTDSENPVGWKATLNCERYNYTLANSGHGDCETALPLCNDFTDIGPSTGDLGTVDDEDEATCFELGYGGTGSIWYTFNPQTSGALAFDLNPSGSTDYDFALFDITNGCENMDYMSCNYSVESGNTGMTTNSSNYEDSHDDSAWGWYEDCNSDPYNYANEDCGPWNEDEYVDPTHTYVLLVNFYGGSNDGFQIDFDAFSGSVSIGDDVPPTFLDVSYSGCNVNSIDIEFSELIDCSTLDNSDFSISGYTVSLGSYSCNGGMSNSITLNISPALPAGSYTLTGIDVFDMCGNELDDNFDFTIPPTTVSVVLAGPDFCVGGSTTITSTVTGSGTYTYEWSTGETGNSISTSTAGTYCVTVTDECNATGTDCIDISELPLTAITPTIAGVTTVCDNGETVDITASPAGATYQWSTGANTQSINVGFGSYTVTVTTDNCEEGTATHVISELVCLDVDMCYDGTDIQGLAGDGTFIWEYYHTCGDWMDCLTNPSGWVSYGSSTSVSPPPEWGLQVTDGNGSTATYNSLGEIPSCSNCTAPTVAATSVDVICQGGNNGSIDLTITGTSTYNIAWSNGSNMEDISTLSAGSYTVSVTDQTDATCQTIQTINILDGTADPSLTASGTTTICDGDNTDITVNFTGTAPFSFTYDDGGTPIVQSGISANPYTITVSPTSNTTYTFTEVSDASCTNTLTETVIITVETGLTIAYLTDDCLASGTEYVVTFEISGGDVSTYLVTPSGTLTGSNPTLFTSNNLSSPSNYNFDITDAGAGGCSMQNVSGFVDCSCPVTAAILGTTTICEGETATVSIDLNGGVFPYTIVYSDGSSNYTVTANSSPYTISVNASGTYSLISVEDANCTGSVSGMATIIVNPLPDVYLSGDDQICAGEDADITFVFSGTPPFNLIYSDGASNHTVVANTSPYNVNINPNVNTSYSIVSFSDANCNGTTNGTATIQVYGTGNVTISPSNNLICFGDNITLTASGADTYQWYPTNGLSNSNSEFVIATPSVTTEYTVVGTYGPGCQLSATAMVTVDKVVAEIHHQSAICQGEIIDLLASVTDGISPYQYHWENTNNYTDTYTTNPMHESQSFLVNITDSMGCQATASIGIYVYDSLFIKAYSNVDSLCPGDTVLVSTSIYGGTGSPYSLQIDGEYRQTITKLRVDASHDYIFEAQDGCMTAIDTLKIKVFPLPYIDFTVDKNALCKDDIAYFTSTCQPRSLISSYLWNFGSNDQNNISTAENPEHIYKSSGLFNVSLDITTINNCKLSLTKHRYMRVDPRPKANFIGKPEITSILKPEIYFDNMSIGASVYHWDFGAGDLSNIENPIYEFNSVGNYEVMLIAISNFSCKDTVIRTITIAPEVRLWFPNAFTPDYDNINEYFLPIGTNILNKEYTMIIFDRWGEPIFTTNDLEQGWDGKAKNNDYVKPGIYTYYVEYLDIYEIKHEATGSISVIR